MHKVDLPVDHSIEWAVERRRSAETARRARIFNTRLRVMGLDLDTLTQQVQEKSHQQNIEKQRDQTFEQLRKYQDEALVQQDIDDKEKRGVLYDDLTRYWATQQRLEDYRDADLKCHLKGAFNITIPEGELGPASMTIFQGEGTGEEQMRREQMQKTERDLRAQMVDNERRHMGDKRREMFVNRELVHQDLKGVLQDELEEDCRKAARIAQDNYNRALAAEQAEELKQQHRREESENLAEIWHTMTSDMMTECAEAAQREVGGGRPPQVLPDRWKGMSPEQLSTIQREREEQHYERQKQRNAERIQDLSWDLNLMKLSREAEVEERKSAELRRAQRIQMDQCNMQLAREQKAHRDYLNKKLNTNKPTRDYFNQFNTSSR
ncbi:RIB43A-like with coiled-coils protein 1 [Embiotoca jacksoni]|uniref:RIB43A-like with coiled-coils protein 1 n=1 Tax=Embiotoca jacksoni TaxID=100190 RepID=UPI00370374CA